MDMGKNIGFVGGLVGTAYGLQKLTNTYVYGAITSQENFPAFMFLANQNNNSLNPVIYNNVYQKSVSQTAFLTSSSNIVLDSGNNKQPIMVEDNDVQNAFEDFPYENWTKIAGTWPTLKNVGSKN